MKNRKTNMKHFITDEMDLIIGTLKNTKIINVHCLCFYYDIVIKKFSLGYQLSKNVL